MDEHDRSVADDGDRTGFVGTTAVGVFTGEEGLELSQQPRYTPSIVGQHAPSRLRAAHALLAEHELGLVGDTGFVGTVGTVTGFVIGDDGLD